MSNEILLQQICEDLDAAIENMKAKAIKPTDCYSTCHTAYEKCMENAGSNIEKAVCKAKYNRCIANC